MSGYPIEIRLASKAGYHTPDEARAYYGKYARDGFTVHWWNSPNRVQDSDHDNIVNYMLGKASQGASSVNYVLSNKKITLVVNPDNVAWASQSGNPTTISCEFSPHLNTEGYKKAGWLVWQLDQRYGRKLTMYKHSNWNLTACPGHISPTKIRQEANKWADGKYNPPPEPKPVPKPTTIITDWKLWKETEQVYVANKQPTYLYDLSKATDWNTIKKVKTFDVGDKITIAGSFRNTRIDRTYYVTRYSFDRKIANGFHPTDLDVYVPPRPIPKPPTEPVEPTDPVEPEPTEYPNWFINFWKEFIHFLKSILKIKD